MNVARGTEDRRVAVRAIAGNVFDARETAGVTRKAMAKARPAFDSGHGVVPSDRE